jgi:hypothetical protein
VIGRRDILKGLIALPIVTARKISGEGREKVKIEDHECLLAHEHGDVKVYVSLRPRTGVILEDPRIGVKLGGENRLFLSSDSQTLVGLVEMMFLQCGLRLSDWATTGPS